MKADYECESSIGCKLLLQNCKPSIDCDMLIQIVWERFPYLINKSDQLLNKNYESMSAR